MTPADYLGAGAAICCGLCGVDFLTRGIRAIVEARGATRKETHVEQMALPALGVRDRRAAGDRSRDIQPVADTALTARSREAAQKTLAGPSTPAFASRRSRAANRTK